MNMTTITADELAQIPLEKPGAQLAAIREKKGFTREYVAGRLHLRVKVIEFLETDDYSNMPEPVFIKGYLRAYAKLLGTAPEPFLLAFNNHHSEKRPDKTLWQNRKESHKNERLMRWLTIIFSLVAICAISLWWYQKRDGQSLVTLKSNKEMAAVETQKSRVEPEIRLTDLSKMQSMFSMHTEGEQQRG